MRIIIRAMRLKSSGAIQMSLPTVQQVLNEKIMAERCTDRHSVSMPPKEER